MLLEGQENRKEVEKVLRYLEVDESTIKYLGCFDVSWRHKFEGFLGGRDGWSGLLIDKGPDYDCLDPEEDEKITVDGIDYLIHEGD